MYKLSLCLTLLSALGFAQDIQFNDPQLLSYLTTVNCVDVDGDGNFDATADMNNDGQIQVDEAQQVLNFSFYSGAGSDIQDLGGFENFSNIKQLNVSSLGVDHLDFSIFPMLEFLRLSSSIDSFAFDNPLLKHFELQNVGFNDPVFDLTNLPALEYVRIQSYHLTDNLIFGTHNHLEELRIHAGEYSSLNLSGMPNLKYLTVADFTGTELDISNCTLLEEFVFRYTDNFNSLIGEDASPHLEIIDFLMDGDTNPSNLVLSFNNQSLNDIYVSGAQSFSISNNTEPIGRVDIGSISGTIDISNSNFGYIDSSLDGEIWISGFGLQELNLTNIEGLKLLYIQDFSPEYPLDLSTVKLNRLSITGESNLSELNLKNGEILEQFNSSIYSDIQFICIDNGESTIIENGYANPDSPVVIHPYCTFVLGGEYYEVKGDVLVDLGNGCQQYPESPVFDLKFTVTDGQSTDVFYPTSSNDYSYTLPEGNHQLSSELLNLDDWTVSPANLNLEFPADGTPFIQDFCVIPVVEHNDLEVFIMPLNEARPGFQADYKIIYRNKGTTTLSGSIDLDFYDDLMNFVVASPETSNQSTGNLSWDYTSLFPFETREIDFSMLLNTPTDPDFPLIGGEILDFIATVNPLGNDETPQDNIFEFNQEIVNSFDPNDITCLQGNSIPLEKVGDYVHYRIRFENTGTANAQNIVVKDVINTDEFDLSSLTPLYGSHDFYTRIVNDNKVEFIFENIQLPFDDANNDGFVLFKIKTSTDLDLGDTFNNQAEIYFDYNFPILTNLETTIIENNLSYQEVDVKEAYIFPNPAYDFLTVKSENYISRISVYDTKGRLIKIHGPNLNVLEYKLDVKHLTAGIYYLEVQFGNKKQMLKFIRK